ncbi:MAG TPA: acyl-CoA thioesterase [Jiangellaceae bacterium]|nr:acyl-CoA thioesterase [Jiangellaceae bacterium]
MTEQETVPSGPAASVVVERRVDWMDTDAAGQHHNTAITRMVEAAEAVLHTRLGIAGETFGRTPRARSETNFRARLRFNDVVRTALWVAEMGRTSLRYEFTVHRGQELVADGALVIVSFDPERERTVEWPEHQRSLLLRGGPQGGEFLQCAAGSSPDSPKGNSPNGDSAHRRQNPATMANEDSDIHSEPGR